MKTTDSFMKNIFCYFIFLFFTSVLAGGCHSHSKADGQLASGDTLHFEYARNIEAIRYPDHCVVKIRNPWDTLTTLHTYILGERGTMPNKISIAGTKVCIPVKRSIVYSSVHNSLFLSLGAVDQIAGVCDLKYITLPEIQSKCQQNIIKDCGNSMNPDLETIIDAAPDAIFLSPFENSGGYGKIEKLNIPIIECADYMESSPLGRAEWMKFYGLLTGKEKEADSLFRAIEQEYLFYSSKAKAMDSRPSVLCELKNGSAWYVPTRKSTTGRLIADAGGKYLFDYLEGYGAVALPAETVIDKAHQADIWMVKYGSAAAKTYSQLASEYVPYSSFKAFKTRRIYGCNTFQRPFYEESPFHPHLLLKDMIKILHPDLLQDYLPRYFTPLDE